MMGFMHMSHSVNSNVHHLHFSHVGPWTKSVQTEIICGFVTMISLIHGFCLVLADTHQHCT